ncbi:MAG: hypothetical protein JW885_08365 [Deltaproteobacteria bacterium]|nr:hypothetical protein [Candidatus Zymogenaceae bacterium]
MSTPKSEDGGITSSPEQNEPIRFDEKSARELHEALDDIRYIRELVDNNRDFFISGWSAIAWGLSLVIGGILTHWFLAHPPQWGLSETLWALWIVMGSAATVVESYFIYKLTLQAGKEVFSPYLLKILTADTIMVLQGIVLTLVFIEIGRPEYIPGAFMLTIGGIIISVGTFITFWISLYGAITFVFALVAMLLPDVGIWCLVFYGAVSFLLGVWYLIVHKK